SSPDAAFRRIVYFRFATEAAMRRERAGSCTSGRSGPDVLNRNRLPCLALAALLMTAGLMGQSAPPGLSKHDRDMTMAMLRQRREDFERNYYDPTFHGVDVKARFAEAESRLQTAGGINEAIAILSESLSQFKDSHTAFYPPNRATRADYGWQMAMVGDEALVVDVSPRSDAAAQGVALGDRVLSLNRFQPTRENLWQILHLYRFVRPQA